MWSNKLAFNVTKRISTSLSEGRSAVVEIMDDIVDAIIGAVDYFIIDCSELLLEILALKIWSNNYKD